MEMFNRFEGQKEIDIWIDSDFKPSHVLQMARKLRASAKTNVSVPPKSSNVQNVSNNVFSIPQSSAAVRKFREKLQFRKKNDQGDISATVSLSNNMTNASISMNNNLVNADVSMGNAIVCKTTSVSISPSPRRSLRLTENVGNNSVSIPPSPKSPEFVVNDSLVISPRRSLRLSQSSMSPTTQMPHVNENITVEDVDTTPKKKGRLSQADTNDQLKLPKSTAMKRGLYVPKTRSNIASGEGSSRMVTRGNKVTYDVTEDSDSEGSFVPGDEDLCEDDDDVSDLEAEDNLICSTLEHIDDGYVPYAEPVWSGSEDDGYSAKLWENGELYNEVKFGAIRLRPWMLFADKEHFKDVLRDFCIQEGFSVIVIKADAMRYTAECATVNCEWRIHASVLADERTWAIKSIRSTDDHGCVGVKTHNPMANSEWVAHKLLEDIRANTAISGSSINKLLMARYGLEMKTSTIYKMKELALTLINGGQDESYKLLPTYVEVVKQTNPGSYAHCTWRVMNNPQKSLQFRSIFVSFKAQFSGVLAGCRSLIGVDGTHLKGNHGGVLLSAIAMDVNNELFPIAVAVVDSENKDSWSFFFTHSKNVLEDNERTEWTIISDRQKGIEPALDEIWPQAYRRFCARHLCKNFKTEYPGLLMYNLFWRVVNSTSEYTFKKALEAVVETAGRGCARWFLDLGSKEHWTKHKFNPRVCSDKNTSNFVESFNSTIGVHRLNPVLSLLEDIRRMAMVRHATRKQTASKWRDDAICPKIRERIRNLKKESKACQAYASEHRWEYEISDGGAHLPVDLKERTCACGLWQISGIPCKHGIRAILFAGLQPANFVSDWFSVKTYKKAYGLSIHPIPDSEQWPPLDMPTLEPPTLKRSIGRPSRNRRREPGEQKKGKRSITIRCKKCKCLGHNSKTCKGGYTAREREEMHGKVTQKRSRAVTRMTPVSSQFKSLDELEGVIMRTTQATQEENEASTSTGKRRKTN